jgi:glyoxylase-like metal-dependent hydrolase (beta-lactamase superfamily II)
MMLSAAASAVSAASGPVVEQVAPNLYAYISDNDHSANSTFLVGPASILVVDAGLNRTEGGKLLREIRKVSPLPVAYIVNTHYHPDHQGGDGVVGPDAAIISSPFTREKTVDLAARMGAAGSNGDSGFAFRPATMTLSQELTIYLGENPVEIHAAWPAHTMGDVYVYFPKQRTVASGDLYLTRSLPDMDDGSAAHWVEDLDQILSLPADHFVPGHFEVGTRQTIQHFRDYIADLNAQVQQMVKAGATEEQVRQKVQLPKYDDLRQFPQYKATYADNAAAVFHQLHDSK